MALEPGGYADKLGNRYEGRWVYGSCCVCSMKLSDL